MQDDGYDYTAVHVVAMNGVAGLRSTPFSEPPKPTKQTECRKEKEQTSACIGKRRVYSRNVASCVYWLERHGFSVEEISKVSGIPKKEIGKILLRGTEMQISISKRIAASSMLSIPSVKTIIRLLNEEPHPNDIMSGRK